MMPTNAPAEPGATTTKGHTPMRNEVFKVSGRIPLFGMDEDERSHVTAPSERSSADEQSAGGGQPRAAQSPSDQEKE
jgi:hypothetical protein